jgi:hypothetical protein
LKTQAIMNARVWVPVCFWSSASVAIVWRTFRGEEMK